MRFEKFLPKAELEHGEYYEGGCRNAAVARWNADTQKFYYRRHKFGTSFIEEIHHADDDNVFDVFNAVKKIDPIDPPINFEEAV